MGVYSYILNWCWFLPNLCSVKDINFPGSAF